MAVSDYKGKYPKHKGGSDLLHTTMTTLVHHEKDTVKAYFSDTIDSVRTLAIELPPQDFYRKFDIVTAQNSVFFWSDNPELATTNMWKMLKDKGVALVTIPPVPRTLNGQPFDTKQYLSSSPLFTYEELGKNTDGCISIALQRKDIDESELPHLLTK